MHADTPPRCQQEPTVAAPETFTISLVFCLCYGLITEPSSGGHAVAHQSLSLLFYRGLAATPKTESECYLYFWVQAERLS